MKNQKKPMTRAEVKEAITNMSKSKPYDPRMDTYKGAFLDYPDLMGELMDEKVLYDPRPMRKMSPTVH